MIVQIIGLPGAGKTELALALKERTNAIHLNADEIRATVNSDLGFNISDRIEHSRRLGEMAKLLSSKGHTVIVDFVCPTSETRKSFGDPDFLVWVDRVKSSRFKDTDLIWTDPDSFDIKIDYGYTVEEEVEAVIAAAGLFDWSAPSTLQLGRYQPWHEGHEALKDEAHKRTEQVLVGVRNTYKTSEKDPLPYDRVKKIIYDSSKNTGKDTLVLRLPNITNIVYGRDVGYKIEYINLPPEIQAISATQKRKDLGI